jgi:hypothetical protein
MPKVMLTQTWVFRGKIYEQGEREIPDDLAAVLVERGFLEPAQAPDPLVALRAVVGDDVMETLYHASLDTHDAISGANDEMLLSLPGIGRATLGKIRKHAPHAGQSSEE